MFTLTNFAFVINRHPLTPLGDENGQKKPFVWTTSWVHGSRGEQDSQEKRQGIADLAFPALLPTRLKIEGEIVPHTGEGGK
jgi:hypothetical protein